MIRNIINCKNSVNNFFNEYYLGTAQLMDGYGLAKKNFIKKI